MNNEISLYLRMHLTQDCQIEMTIKGEMTVEALERLAAFIELTKAALKVSQENKDTKERR